MIEKKISVLNASDKAPRTAISFIQGKASVRTGPENDTFRIYLTNYAGIGIR
jgi:hypothetical protein